MSINLQAIKQVATIFLIVFSMNSMAAVYYVSEDGNDENSGTSPGQAWRTLDKVNSYQFWAGDQILFKRGNIWRGTITCNYSGSKGKPIIYGAFGEGANPIIYGSEVITGWTLHEGNIYKATVTSVPGQIFVDGIRFRIARYPDEGYFNVNSVSGTTTFTSNALNSEINYAGATWYGRTRYWYGVIRKVASSSSKTITLDSAPNGEIAVGQGFVLMNKMEFLSQPGEWFLDKESNELYLWTPEGDSPDNYTVTASVYSNGIYNNRKNYLRFTDLDLREQSENGIFLYGCSNVEVENNNILYPEQYGISAEGGNSLTIRNNVINRANGGGMWLWTKDSRISDNRIDHTGVFAEIGLKGTTAPNGGSGAEISGENNRIEYNIIENSNYNGLFFRGAGTAVQYNFFNNSCLVKDDGGGIYTGTSGSGAFVRYNIVVNSVGNPEGYTSIRSMAEGIYIDEIAQNVVVEHNTILNTGDAAIKLHNVGNIQVDSNKVMVARYGIWCHNYVGSPSPITNNTVYMTSNTNDYEPRPLFVRVGTYNTQFDHNKYFNPKVSVSTQVFKESSYLTFTQWKSTIQQDVHSEFNSTPLAAGESADLIYNASKTVKKYNLNGAVVKDTDGNTLSGSFTLEPYTSVILIGRNIDRISEVADTIPPAITSFSVPSSATSLTVDVLSYTATDDIAVTGYMVTETSTPPLADETGWTVQVPASYKFPEAGTYTLYAWAKDAAGNVSEPASVSVNVHIPDYSSAYLEYLFEETSDTTVTDTQGFNDGTIINEATRKEGVKGNGLELSGMGYIDAGQGFADRVLDEVTLSAWVKPSAGSGGYQGLIVHGGQDSITFGLFLNRDLNSIAFKTSGTSSWWVAANDATELWDGGWHHVTVSYNGSEKTIYLDNVALKTVAATGAVNSGYGNNLLVGAGTDEDSPGLFYYGLIDEVRVFNYGLTASDVSDYYYSVVDTTTSVARYRNEKYLHFYPNPFKNHLTINTLETGKDITIDIFNASGSLIRSFTDSGKNMKPVIWDGRNENGVEVASGFYFIRLLMGNIVETGKVYKDR